MFFSFSNYYALMLKSKGLPIAEHVLTKIRYWLKKTKRRIRHNLAPQLFLLIYAFPIYMQHFVSIGVVRSKLPIKEILEEKVRPSVPESERGGRAKRPLL